MILEDKISMKNEKFQSQLRRQQELKLINMIIRSLFPWDNSIGNLLMSQETEQCFILAKINSLCRIFLHSNMPKTLETNKEVTIQMLNIKE